ncbi:MAG: hypothetical protein AABY43_03070 [Candidatus Omnitrophota bacterium]
MPYDKNLDQEIFSESSDFGDSKITVSVFSYNKGEPKLQISRQVRRAQDEWIFSKLGRLTKAEAEVVTPLIQKAMGKM